MKVYEAKEEICRDELPNQTEVTSGKSGYSTPRITVFGKVAALTQGSLSVGNDPSVGNSRKNAQSDRATKENIVRVGTHPLGIGLYLFNYKKEFWSIWGNDRQFGVMADEVETILPEAVSVHSNGYKMVDYGQLGITHTYQ